MASYTFDAWDGKTVDELKEDCRRLCRASDHWQHIALALSETADLRALPLEWKSDVERLQEAYRD